MVVASARARPVPAVVVLGGVAAAAWVALAAGVGGHTSHDEVLGHGHALHLAEVAALIAGWQLMVAAMMLPPEVGSAVRDSAVRTGVAAACGVVAVTAAVWTAFAIVALSGDSLVHELAGSRPWLAHLVAPAVLIGAGLFQLTPVKRRLLDATRCTPTLSWRHTLSCLGNCGTLMLVMFAVGVGSLIWMAVLTAVMVAERAVRPALAPWVTSFAGVALIITALHTTAGHHSMIG
ncbi:MAG TPA: DUF2182 domain-containing protein [Streptosporangiaceae bacterium]